MKNLLIISILSTSFLGNVVFSQNNGNNGQGSTQWKTNGNIADTNHFIGTKNDYPVKFRANDIERLRITSDGKVGVGLTSPQGKLHVLGGTILEGLVKLPLIEYINSNNLSLNNFDMVLINHADNTLHKIDQSNFQKTVFNLNYGPLPVDPLTECDIFEVNGRWRTGPYKLYTNCPIVNVGIGTNTPTHNLHVIGNSLFESTMQIDGTLAIGTSPSTFSRFKIRNSLYPAGIEINQSGNINAYNKLILLQFDNPTTEIIKVVNTNSNVVPFLLEGNGRMTIHNGTQKILQLNPDGVLQTRTVKVDVYNWPDYVFEPTYDLMSLSEIKEYINDNGHLPNVPSAEETEKDGINLGEMNKILLQKIEELTLHMLKQEERILELEQNRR